MSDAAVEFYEPENRLIKKTGTGGLPEGTLQAIQGRVESMSIDVMPFLKEKIASLKTRVYSDDFITNDKAEAIHDFLSDLVGFAVNVKLTKNTGLIHISAQLLKFVERLEGMTMDGFHVVKAHVNALDLILKKGLDSANHPIITALVAELDNACERYNSKYKVDMTG